MFSLSRLRLEAEVAQQNRAAEKVLGARRDANFLLTTILWGNVGINVLLTLLSDSVMAGVAAFFFSTFAITFLEQVLSAGTKWAILVDPSGEPGMVLNSESFLRDALFGRRPFNPYLHCHRPIVVRDSKAGLGDAITRLKVSPERAGDDVIDEDIILYWSSERRVITGSDILGRLLRGIARQEGPLFRRPEVSTA